MILLIDLCNMILLSTLHFRSIIKKWPTALITYLIFLFHLKHSNIYIIFPIIPSMITKFKYISVFFYSISDNTCITISYLENL